MNNQNKPKHRKRDVAEWSVAIVSIVIVIGMVGIITYNYIKSDRHYSAIQVKPQIQAVKRKDSNYYLPVIIVNTGDETAKDIWIQVFFDFGENNAINTQFKIDFLAGNDYKEETIILNKNPIDAKITQTVSFNAK